MILEWELRGRGTHGSGVDNSGSCHCKGCPWRTEGSRHRLSTSILGAHQDSTELRLGNVLWLGQNKQLLYNFKLKIIQL